MTTSSERRLHPLSMLFGNRRTVEVLLPSAFLIPALADRGGVWLVAAAVAAMLVVVFTVALLRYLRFTYRLDGAELVVRSGVLTRTVRTIPYVRIQTLDASQNLLQRALSLTVVHVQTGSGAMPEATLRVLPLAALVELRERVLAASDARSAAEVEPADGVTADPDSVTAGSPASAAGGSAATRVPRVLLHLPPRRLLLAGFLENRGFVLIFGAFALLHQGGMVDRMVVRVFGQDGGIEAFLGRWYDGRALAAGEIVMLSVAAALVLLLFIRLLSTVWGVVRLYDFRLTQLGDEMHTEYGLFTRVRATIPLRRIQTVVIRETRLHRLLGYRMVLVETAGGAMTDMAAAAREPLAPLIALRDLPALLQELGVPFDPAGIVWQPVHARAWRRIVAASLLWVVVPAGIAIMLVGEWAVLVIAALLVNAAVRAALRHRNLGWSGQAESLVVRDGALLCETRIVRFSRIQVVALERSPFDVRSGMARVRADTAGALSFRRTVIPFLPLVTAVSVHESLSEAAAATSFTW